MVSWFRKLNHGPANILFQCIFFLGEDEEIDGMELFREGRTKRSEMGCVHNMQQSL